MKRAKALSIKWLIGLCNHIEDPRRVWGNKRHELTTNRYPRRQFQFRSAADVAADFLASDGWAT